MVDLKQASPFKNYEKQKSDHLSVPLAWSCLMLTGLKLFKGDAQLFFLQYK